MLIYLLLQEERKFKIKQKNMIWANLAWKSAGTGHQPSTEQKILLRKNNCKKSLGAIETSTWTGIHEMLLIGENWCFPWIASRLNNKSGHALLVVYTTTGIQNRSVPDLSSCMSPPTSFMFDRRYKEIIWMLKMGKTSLSGILHVPGSFTSTVSTQYQTKKNRRTNDTT